jgi:hypothetical protein
MGKTHEDSVRELAEKTPYTTGKVHDLIVKFKKPLVLVLNLMSRIPEPSVETLKRRNANPNALLLIELRDEFFKHFNLPSRAGALKAIINFGIMMYAYDAAYVPFMHWWLKALVKAVNEGRWDFSGDHKRHWKE